MKKIKGTITVDTERCKGCDLCVEACPVHILALSKSEINRFGYFYAEMTDGDKCIGCASCGITCPDACITVFRCKDDEE